MSSGRWADVRETQLVDRLDRRLARLTIAGLAIDNPRYTPTRATGTGAGFPGPRAQPVILRPGATCTLGTVTFTPTTTGPTYGTATLTTTSGRTGPTQAWKLALTGTGTSTP